MQAKKCSFLAYLSDIFTQNKPIQSLFAVSDNGLHLNFEGSSRLSRFFHNKPQVRPDRSCVSCLVFSVFHCSLAPYDAA